MPSVPYSGVPTVAPQDTPVPRYTADVTPAAFGVNVAQAVEGLGKTTEGVGNEIFARGQAMQDLYNHSEAQQAASDYMQKAGELHANYSSLAGKAAVDAYPQYIKDLQKARTDIAGGLSNDMSRKLYDGESLSTQGRTIFNGAGHAATQNKIYAVGSSQARVDAIANRTLQTPADEDTFQDGLQDAEDEVRAQGQLNGWGPDLTAEKIAQQKSDLWGQRISGLVKSQPLAASKMLDKAVADGEVRGQDIAKLTNMVQQANHTVGARMISHEVTTGGGTRWGAGQVDIKAAANAIGTFETGNNYGAMGVQTAHGKALGKYQVMEENLPEFLAKAGLPAMSAKDFLADHAAQDQVFASVFGGYMKQYGSFNDAASVWFSGKPQATAGGAKDALGTTVPTYVAATNAILAKNAPLSAKVSMGQSIATERAPDDPLMQDAVRDRIESDHNRVIQIKRDDNFQSRQVIETALMGGQDGKLPTTVEELQHDPKAGAAWDQLVQNDPAAARRYMGVLARNSKGDHAWNDDSLRLYQRLKGQAQNDPASFIDQDVIGTALPNGAKREMINLQGTLKDKSEGDPRVGRALAILAPDLQAAGIDRKDKETYNEFTGALADQLQTFAEEQKRAPKTDEVKTIGARLLQAQSRPGRFWGTNESPTFQVPVPAEEAEKIKADPAWEKLQIKPTEQQIQRIYTRKLYQDLYGGQTKADKAMAANGPKPPVSQ